jgi:hypothetical protein
VLHRNESLWRLAAGVYIRILSRPQLYIEGNHRTGALLMSYILVRQGQPPFALTVDNAKVHFKLSMLITHTKKHGLPTLFRLPKLKKNLARFLQEHIDEKHLLHLLMPLPLGSVPNPWCVSPLH